MQKRTLGRDGPLVGAVALGCMSFGGMYGPTDEAESHRTLARALELGVDHLDTADVYGPAVSEEVIGSFLRQNPHSFTIATKAGITRKPEHPFDNSPDYLRRCLEASLRRLGVDHVDLYYIHRREQSRPIEEVVETMARFKKEGKIGGIGFSEISPASLERASAIHPIMAVQSEYSLWTRLPELGLIQACARLGTALVAFSPLGRGMFSDSPPTPHALAEKDFRKHNPRFVEPNYTQNARSVARFAALAREKGYTPAALAIAWTLHRGPHVIPIPGTRSADHLAEDAAAAAITLSEADMADIEAVLPIGFAHGERYTPAQARGPEDYC